jgi:hypothetical protein
LTQDAPARRVQVLNQLGAQGHQAAIGITIRMQQSLKPVPDAHDLPSHFACCQSRAHNHCIHTWNEAGTHIDSNASSIYIHDLPSLLIVFVSVFIINRLIIVLCTVIPAEAGIQL